MSMQSPAKARPRPRPTPRFSQPLAASSPAATSTPGAGSSKPRTSMINNSTASPIVAREVIDLTTNPIIYISSDDDSEGAGSFIPKKALSPADDDDDDDDDIGTGPNATPPHSPSPSPSPLPSPTPSREPEQESDAVHAAFSAQRFHTDARNGFGRRRARVKKEKFMAWKHLSRQKARDKRKEEKRLKKGILPRSPSVKVEPPAESSGQIPLSPGIEVKAESSSSSPSPGPTSEDEVLANATQAPGSDEPVHGSQASQIAAASAGLQDEDDEEEKGEGEGKEGSQERSMDKHDLQPEVGKAPKVDTAPSSTSPGNKEEEDDEENDDLYDVPANYAAAVKQSTITSASPKPSTSFVSSTPISTPPPSVKSPIAPANSSPSSPQPPPINEGSSDEDEPLHPDILFSQSLNLAASQSRRKLANEALNSFRDDEDEDEETKDPLFGVKAQMPDVTMSIPNAFFSAEARKREPSPDDFVLVDSSPEPEQSPLKGSLKRQMDSHDHNRPTKRSRTQSSEGVSHKREPKTSTPRGKSTRGAEVPINEFKRDEDLWLLDGSVIVQIKDIGFRLHETLLSIQFGFFKKLFSSGSRPTRYLHKVPVYAVKGNPEDFKQLVLYTLHHRSDNVPFRTLAHIARGAQHFEMERALEDMDRLLSALYPDSTVGTTGHSYAADAVALAEDCPTFNFILKPAMYDLLCQPMFRFGLDGGTDAGAGNEGALKSSCSFRLSEKRLFQLIAAREALLEQWQTICGRESCLVARGTEPSNNCRCDELFPEEALSSTDEEFSEAEIDERRDRRQHRMIDAWTRRIYSPPTPPLQPSSDTEAEDVKGTPIKKEHKTNGLSVNNEVEVPAGNKSIMSIGSLDIILGLKLMARETWEDLECDSCLRVRRKKWKKKQASIWEMLGDLFGYYGTDT